MTVREQIARLQELYKYRMDMPMAIHVWTMPDLDCLAEDDYVDGFQEYWQSLDDTGKISFTNEVFAEFEDCDSELGMTWEGLRQAIEKRMGAI